MKIKKSYKDIVVLLEANKDKQVKDILSEVYELAKTVRQENINIRDDKNNVVAIFCWFHKQYEVLSDVEFGSKKNSSTGLNQMCKVGTRDWSKRQALIKKLSSKIVELLRNDKLKLKDVDKYQANEETKIKQLTFEPKPKGFKTLDELVEHLKKTQPDLKLKL